MVTMSQELSRYFGWLLKHFGYEPYHIIEEYNWSGNHKTYWEKKKCR
jgi:hypothetical protein